MHTFKNVVKIGDKFISAEEDLTYIYKRMVIVSNDEPIKKGDSYLFEDEIYRDTDSERYLELMNKEENKYRYKKVMFSSQVMPKSIIILTKDTKIRIECDEHHEHTVSGGLQRVGDFGGKGLTHHDYTYYTPKYGHDGNLVIYDNTIHSCIYSRTLFQEYPRKCTICGKPEDYDNVVVKEDKKHKEVFDWYSHKYFTINMVEHAFNESRLTHSIIGFKHIDFREYLNYMFQNETHSK